MSERNYRSEEFSEILKRKMELTFALVLTTVLLVSCNGDNVTQTKMLPIPPPLPPPLAANMTGSWVGTVSSNDPADCTDGAPAQATFKQIGSAVTGILNAEGDCGPTKARFQGTRQGNDLTGTIIGDKNVRSVDGLLSAKTLGIVVSYNPSNNLFRNVLHLHR
jgi:hypothetical protein